MAGVTACGCGGGQGLPIGAPSVCDSGACQPLRDKGGGHFPSTPAATPATLTQPAHFSQACRLPQSSGLSSFFSRGVIAEPLSAPVIWQENEAPHNRSPRRNTAYLSQTLPAHGSDPFYPPQEEGQPTAHILMVHLCTADVLCHLYIL